jgi:hypothetical protein
MNNIPYNTAIFEADDYDVSGYFVVDNFLNESMATENGHVQTQITSYLAEAKEVAGIQLADLHQLAKSMGVKDPETISLKMELIGSIQKALYQSYCFGADARIYR